MVCSTWGHLLVDLVASFCDSSPTAGWWSKPLYATVVYQSTTSKFIFYICIEAILDSAQSGSCSWDAQFVVVFFSCFPCLWKNKTWVFCLFGEIFCQDYQTISCQFFSQISASTVSKQITRNHFGLSFEADSDRTVSVAPPKPKCSDDPPLFVSVEDHHCTLNFGFGALLSVLLLT